MNELTEAIHLLDSPLVWSDDLEAIREPLTQLFKVEAQRGLPNKFVSAVAAALLDDFSNDVAVG